MIQAEYQHNTDGASNNKTRLNTWGKMFEEDIRLRYQILYEGSSKSLDTKKLKVILGPNVLPVDGR